MSTDWKLGTDKRTVGKKQEDAVLVGLIHGSYTDEDITDYLDELEFLALTAGANTVARFVQKLPHPNPRTFVGTGKLDEIREYLEVNEDVVTVIFDDDLTGKQVRILEKELKVKIIDRTSLILDIFASRAQTSQAQTQVELAQLQYLLPRLVGLWTHLERQRGGIGMRGPGEKEIETDRRIIRDKISFLKKKLEKIDRQSTTRRKNRQELIRVALVGYTNVGKSTILNLLTDADVFAENKLFATLDTTVRKIAYEGVPFLITDTVGFIRKLPTHLVESFKSTLDEVREADILLHVVDVAHPHFNEHIKSVNSILKDISADNKPTLMVFNKMDLYRERQRDELMLPEDWQEVEDSFKEALGFRYGDAVFISAVTKEQIQEMRAEMLSMVKKEYVVRYPYRAKHWDA